MKTSFKKLLCVIMALAIMLTSAILTFAEENCDCGNTPVIFVSGFGATYLKEIKDDGSEEVVFPPSKELILSILKKNVGKLKSTDIRDFIYAVIADILEPISADENGNPKHNLVPIYESVEDTSYDGFVRNGATAYIPYGDSDFLDMHSSAERIGGDHVFNFLYDWRLSGDEAADLLREYIEDVKAVTGHSKVSIHCLSQGAVPVAQYLYKYAEDGSVDNLIFENPILDGSDFVSDLLNGRDGTYNLNYKEVLDLLEEIIHTELNISELVSYFLRENHYGAINTQVKLGAEKVVFPIAKNSPAYLEMVPSDKFDKIAGEYYSSAIIEKANKVMDGYRADISGTIRKAIEYGAEISIFASSGLDLVTGTKVSSDSIVNLTSACGAFVAEEGTSFPSSYVQKVQNGKNMISPDRTIDLSCGYLPERTWILNERYHCMLEWAPISLALTEELLFTHNVRDAFSDERFPQFIQTDDPNHYIHAAFENTNCLYAVQGESGRLILKNTSTKNPVIISSVSIDGADITDKGDLPIKLKPGEKTAVSIDTSSVANGKIDVTFFSGENIGQIKLRSFGFSVTDNYSGVISSKQAEIKAQNVFERLSSKIQCFLSSLVSKLFRLSRFAE